jgi:hypothetical protein
LWRSEKQEPNYEPGQPIRGSYHIAAKSAIFVRKIILVQYNQ